MNSTEKKPDTTLLLTCVIPVYNEIENIPVLFDEIRETIDSLPHQCDIIFVDDHSTDGGCDLLQTIADDHDFVRLLKFAKNSGQSAALAAGFQHARGDFIITMDSDLQNDPRDLLTMIRYIPEYDMVTGMRVNRNDSLIKKFDSRFANAVRNKLSRENITDTGCSLKIMNSSILKKVKMFVGMHRFLPTLMKMEGASVIEVPVNHRPRKMGDSKYGTWDRAFSGFRDLLAIRWMQDRFINYQITEEEDE